MTTKPKLLTFAFCSYNRAGRLRKLVAAMRNQSCSIPYEILAVNNNSTDETATILSELASLPGIPLRWVTETTQGIVAARNRCLAEAMNSDILVFIDDDELPLPGLLESAVRAITLDQAQVAGGKVLIDFSEYKRPEWLADELLGFLAATNYGDQPFWIESADFPIWTANCAYDMAVFRENHDLKFDKRYDRKGKGIGGGEDVIMFNQLLARKMHIRYCPDMVVLHAVEAWRLKRRYFLKLHFISGFKGTFNNENTYANTYFGIPPFLVLQAIKLFGVWLIAALTKRQSQVRKCMNFTYALGQISGYFRRWKDKAENNHPTLGS